MPQITPQLQSTLTCPKCGGVSIETMPTDACQYFYDCRHCGALLKPLAGDCCVFCSYGDVPCPPIQEARTNGVAASAVGVVAAEVDSSNAQSSVVQRDWAGNGRAFALLWGVPIALMLAASSVPPLVHAGIWTLMLLWMGGVCLVNARRCGRTHCRFTGPFFILMAVCVLAYATGVLDLGAHGWSILSVLILVGAIGLWWGSERVLGRFTS